MKPHLTFRQLKRRACRNIVTILAGLVTTIGALGLSSYEATAETYEDIALTEENFPNYCEWLTNANFDHNHDGFLSYEERANITDLEVLYYNSSEISLFPNLTGLTIGYLTEEAADFSECSSLIYLTILDGSLTKLDDSQIGSVQYLTCHCPTLETLELSDLVYFDCSNNNLTTLESFHIPNLRTLDCSNNNFAELDLSMFPNLTGLYCNNNYLTELDLSMFPNLTGLYCNNNYLTELDLSDFDNLSTLSCNNNKLTTLDLHNCSQLYRLDCSNNQIVSLDISASQRLYSLDCSYNKLTELDTTPFSRTLDSLNCSHNLLTSLKISTLKSIYSVNCSYNELTELSFPYVDGVDFIDFSHNHLQDFDFSDYHWVTDLNCSYNEFESIDIRGCSGYTFDCRNNNLATLDYISSRWKIAVMYQNNPCWDESITEKGIPISHQNFPDQDLFSFASNIDSDQDGFLSKDERTSVVTMSSITSAYGLAGVENFPNLEQIDVYFRQDYNIDLSMLKHLKNLSVKAHFTHFDLDLSDLHELESISITLSDLSRDATLTLSDDCNLNCLNIQSITPINIQIKSSDNLATNECTHKSDYLTLISGSNTIYRCSYCNRLINYTCTHDSIREEFIDYAGIKYSYIYCAICGIFLESYPSPEPSVPHGTAGPSITWEINDDTLTLNGEGTMEALTLAEELSQKPATDLEEDSETTEEDQISLLSNQTPLRMSRSVSLLAATPAPAAEISALAVPLAQSDDELAGLLATVKHIVIGEGITNICDHAFTQCIAAETVSIPETVTTIGDYAFAETELAEVVIPDSVTEIGSYAFAGTEIAELTIPESVTTIGSYAFAGTEITELTIPESVTTIGSHAFEDTNLTEVIIPETVTEIGENAFVGVTIYAEEDSAGAQYAEENETTSFTPIACAEGHLVNEAVTENYIEASCTTDGSYDEVSYCQVCGAEISRVHRVIKGEHTIVEDPEVKASCTEDGLTAGSHCSVCGTVLEAQEIIKASGHDFHNGQCEVCGESEIIPLAGPQITTFDLNNNTLTFKWNKVSGAKSYVIYKKAEGSEPVAIATLKGKATSYSVSNYADNADYTFGVSVVLPSEESAISYCEIPSDYLPAPTVSAKKASNAISLTWKQIPSAESYRIYRSTNGKDWAEIAEVSGDTLNFSDQTAKAKTTYYYAVAACKGEFISELKASSKIKR